jgi:hypothetical protein
VLGPAFALGQDHQVGLDARPGEGGTKPAIERKITDSDRQAQITIESDSVARAGGRREVNFHAVAVEPLEQRPDCQHLADADRLQPDPTHAGRPIPESRVQPKTLAEGPAVAASAPHAPEVGGRHHQQRRQKKTSVEPKHDASLNEEEFTARANLFRAFCAFADGNQPPPWYQP